MSAPPEQPPENKNPIPTLPQLEVAYKKLRGEWMASANDIFDGLTRPLIGIIAAQASEIARLKNQPDPVAAAAAAQEKPPNRQERRRAERKARKTSKQDKA